MRVIITGGSGFIGQALTKNLLKNKHEVNIISRNPGHLTKLPVGVTATHWDDLPYPMEGADAVVNLAGASIGGDSPLNVRWSDKRKAHILESRVNSGRRISEAIAKAKDKPEILIQSSAVGFYGAQGDELIDEKHPNGVDFLANVCRDWEDSTKEVEAMGVRRAVVRTGIVFSAKGGLFPFLKLPFSLFVGGKIGSGKQYLSWIHIDDVLSVIRFLIENKNTQGVYNMVAPHPVSNSEFTRMLAKGLKRPALLPVPAFALRFGLGEASTLTLDGQRVVPTRLLESGYAFRYETLALALPALLKPMR